MDGSTSDGNAFDGSAERTSLGNAESISVGAERSLGSATLGLCRTGVGSEATGAEEGARMPPPRVGMLRPIDSGIEIPKDGSPPADGVDKAIGALSKFVSADARGRFEGAIAETRD